VANLCPEKSYTVWEAGVTDCNETGKR
jgi:hypothetical protein